MTNTGTFSPLVNNREYTEDEKTVILHFFTNVDKNVYCATDAMSSQLYAFLVGQYSRSDLSMRDRFLKLFKDAEKSFQDGKISKDDFVSLEDLANEIRSGENKAIEYFNKKSASFLKKWGVDYGHNSLKDADRIRYAVEGVSQVFTKIIEAPFPCLGDFQEKSTRYMNFKKESLIFPPMLEKSEYFEEIKNNADQLLDLYEKYTPIIQDLLLENKIIKREDFQRELAYKNTLDAKTFDIVRYLLPSNITTSLGANFSARIAESHISEMLSHSLEEVRTVAEAMHKEGLKVSPGLLSRVAKNEYLTKKRKKSEQVVKEILSCEQGGLPPCIQGIENEDRVTLISCENLDNIIATSILFESGRKYGKSYSECLVKVENLSESEKEKIIDAELNSRGQFDRMPRSLQHGSIKFEFFTDFGSYRDYQRHRASAQIWQGVTAIHGYDYPELIDMPGMDEFKKDYDEIMTKMTELARKIVKDYPHEVEYCAALGHLIRSTFEMNPGQLAYVCELRTTPQGHHSYRRLFQKVHELIQQKAPIFAKYIRVNQDLEATRLKQEERAAEKKERLEII